MSAQKAPPPRDLLLPYQRRWADDEARFKIGCMARQTGKDFSSGFEGIQDIYRHEMKKQRTDWLITAPSERQSLESFNKWKEWQEVFRLALAHVIEERAGGSETLLKSATMIFPNGSRVIAVPGKPDTVRGFSANLLATEFAFFEDPDATWRALLPSITNPLRGGPKKVRLISTPNGIGNKFHDLWVKNFDMPGANWSAHRVTIHDAIAQGLPVNAEELRLALDDPEGWAQEFECEFMDTASVLLPYELIATCESAECTEACPPEFWLTRPANPVFCGIDFARSKDLTVCWSAELIAGKILMTREVLTLRGLSTPAQLEILRPRLRAATRVCFDYTGPGVGLGDLLVEAREGFGEYDPDKHKFGKIELVKFQNEKKVDVFSKLRMAFEQKTVFVPGTRAVREDLHSVCRVALAGGGVTYRAPHSAEGHADRATALALCVRARGTSGGGLLTTAGIHLGQKAVFA